MSTQFNRINKNPKVYCSRNIEYYASVIDEKVHLFAVTYTDKFGINSVSLTYLPNGEVDNAIFLARVCLHSNEHQNKLNCQVVEPRVLHLHKASQEYYEYIFEKKPNNTALNYARYFSDPDAVVLQGEENRHVKDIAKEIFSLKRHKKVNIYSGKSMISDLKNGITKQLER